MVVWMLLVVVLHHNIIINVIIINRQKDPHGRHHIHNEHTKRNHHQHQHHRRRHHNVDATNQHDELVEKHGTDGEDNCILEVLDLLEDCCETVMSTALLKNLRFPQNE